MRRALPLMKIDAEMAIRHSSVAVSEPLDPWTAQAAHDRPLIVRQAALLGGGGLLGTHPWRRESLPDYRDRGGYSQPAGAQVLAAIAKAGLRGRGGAGFLTATKLEAVRNALRSPRYVIANGEEGEPGSVKDRYLMRFRPHAVLDGLQACAAAIAAERAYVYLSDPIAENVLFEALSERPPEIPVRFVRVNHSYVAGEESAAVRAIDGGTALPTVKPPRPFDAGIDGQPTLVLNVETLAQVALIMQDGPASFRRLGTTESKGTFLATVCGIGSSAVLIEVPFGLSVREVLEELGVDPATIQGLLMGGFFGGLLALDRPRWDLPLAYETVAEAGCGLGCGAMMVIGERDCPVSIARRLASFFASENAKQCGACINGTQAIERALLRLSLSEAGDTHISRLRDLSVRLKGRGACATLDAAAGVAGSLLREFPREVVRHLNLPCRRCRETDRRGAQQLQVPVPL